MVIANALGHHNFVKRDAVLVVAAIGSVHDETPHSTHTHVEGAGRGGEADRSPPLRQMLRIAPGLEYQATRRIKDACCDDGFGIAIEVDAISCGHASSPWPAGYADTRRDD